jgi:dolichol-phosphate mannosyltransferase
VSLVLPIGAGSTPSARAIAEYTGVLREFADAGSVEVVVARTRPPAAFNGEPIDGLLNDRDGAASVEVFSDRPEWSELIHVGLSAATGDHVVVLDVNRLYAVDSVARVVAPICAGTSDVAVAVPRRGGSERAGRVQPRNAFGLVSWLFLGTQDVFSGLFAFRRALWEQSGRRAQVIPPSLVLGSMLRRGARCVDVPVDVHDGFQSERLGLDDLRPLKHLLDARFGDYSRLAQFCVVGASGMVVDLAFYALFQWLLSFTSLASRASAFFGCSWHLAIAAALSISIALGWNFTLNRRLTFNDARKGAILSQFIAYALSNALAIALSFSLRLYLPANVDFFGRHRLAAAVVGIVAATGISFSMSRWIVFARSSEPKRPLKRVRKERVGQPSAVP